MTKILLVGVGKMGSALLNGWHRNTSYIISTLDPHAPDADYASAQDITTVYDVVVLAVKPQTMESVLGDIRSLITPSTLVITIAAGKPLAFYETHLEKTIPVVRAMPNTPALVGQGITVCCANASTTPAHRDMTTSLLQTVGAVEWTDDETLMDAVTAISGSGPAYVFHMIEALTDAGQKIGLPEQLAAKLARQTVIGAGALAAAESTVSPATLRHNVTSPGGTTEAGLKILMADPNGLTRLMTDTATASCNRGKELSS